MALLGQLFPEQFPYHPHWKAGLIYPAIPACGAAVDHAIHVARGVTDDIDNLVTACWPCNVRKADFPPRSSGRTCLR